jgi:hypothetical protein
LVHNNYIISTQILHKIYIKVTYRKTTSELHNSYRKTTENPQFSPPVEVTTEVCSTLLVEGLKATGAVKTLPTGAD